MAELGLAVAGLAGTVLLPVITRLATTLLDRIQHQHAKFQTLASLIIRISKSQTHEVLLVLSEQEDTIPEDFRVELHQMFQQLRGIFEELLDLIPDPSQGEHRKLTNKSQKRINDAVGRLDEWNDRFFKRALVYILFGHRRLTVPKVSGEEGHAAVAVHKIEQLRDAVGQSLERTTHAPRLFLPQPTQQSLRRPLPNSALRLVGQPTGTPSESSLVEFRAYSDDATDSEIEGHRRVTRDVAAIMNQADARLMGILHCRGFSHDVFKNRFELHLSFPQGFANPRSLLDVFRDSGTRQGRAVKHSLDQRVELAKSVVSALFVLHSAGLVHKQIRPDNIIVFESRTPGGGDNPDDLRYPYIIGKPFLVGFDSARKVDAASHMIPVEEWHKNLYLSPERHRLQRGDEFNMQHDLFSLGVVLIEIAFWQSFQDRTGTKLSGVLWEDERTMKRPEQLKEQYLALANGPVARVLGRKYSDVVTTCLTGLDTGPARDIRDQDGILIGMAYITEVIKRLEEISL